MAPAARTPFPVDAISIKIHRSPFGMCWRWRTELAVLIAGLAAWLRVSWWLGSYSWSLAVLGGVVLVLAARAVVAAVPGRPVLVPVHPAPAAKGVLGTAAAYPRRSPAVGAVDPPDYGRGAVLGAVPARHLLR